MQNSVLLVDDEPEVSKSLGRILRMDNYQIYIATSGAEALELLQRHPIKMVISDQRMPHMTGSRLLTEVKQKYPETIRMIMSGYSDFQAITDAINQGEITKFVSKPWNNDLLRADVRNAFYLQTLGQRNNQLLHLFESTIEAIVLCDASGIIKWVNPAFCKLTQFIKSDAIGKSIKTIFFDSFNRPLTSANLVSEPAKEWHGELICRIQSGKQLPIWASFVSFENSYEDTRSAALFIDISEQKDKEAKIKYQAFHDDLTGLPNRRLFNDHLELTLHQQRRNKQGLALIFMDLDGFKAVNDKLGHNVGDKLLQGVARRLQKIVRRGETLARFGGDEFVLILPMINSVKKCEIVAEKLLASFQQPFSCYGHKIKVSPSIGIVFQLADEEHSDLLVRRADSAMYQAKALGGNNFQFFDDTKRNFLS